MGSPPSSGYPHSAGLEPVSGRKSAAWEALETQGREGLSGQKMKRKTWVCSLCSKPTMGPSGSKPCNGSPTVLPIRILVSSVSPELPFPTAYLLKVGTSPGYVSRRGSCRKGPGSGSEGGGGGGSVTDLQRESRRWPRSALNLDWAFSAGKEALDPQIPPPPPSASASYFPDPS